VNKDIADMKNLVSSLNIRRQEHVEHLKDTLKQMEDNISKVSNLEDTKQIEEHLAHYKRRVDEIEVDLKNKESRSGEAVNSNFNQRLEADNTRKARSEFEAENKNLADVRNNYDKLLLEHSRLKSENQTLDRQLRDARADLQNVSERKQLKEGGVDLRGSSDRFKRDRSTSNERFYGSGRK